MQKNNSIASGRNLDGINYRTRNYILFHYTKFNSMNKKLRCIMLVDDNHDDNFFHEREIKKNNPATIVIAKNTGLEALEYLKSKTNIDSPI